MEVGGDELVEYELEDLLAAEQETIGSVAGVVKNFDLADA